MTEYQFEVLLCQYKDRLSRYIKSLMIRDMRNSQEDIADVIQNTHVALWRALKTREEDGRDIWGYMMRAAKAQSRMYHRARVTIKRDNEVPLDHALTTTSEPLNDWDCLEQKTVQKVLCGMSGSYRCLLIEYYIEAYTQKEMAVKRHITQQALSGLLNRACEAFRKKWYECTGHRVATDGKWLVTIRQGTPCDV